MNSTKRPLLDKRETPLFPLLQEGERLLKAAGIENARQEAEAILLNLLALKRIDLYLDRERPVSKENQTDFFNRLKRRSRHEPLQYILGEVVFCGLSLWVSSGVFIPRPETELMIEIASSLPFAPKSILDLCTGSGALAIRLAKQFPKSTITAIDCSEIALATARFNQNRHQTPRIVFLKGDLFGPLHPTDSFDLIVCNPPYLDEEDRQKIDPEVLEYEPPVALFSQEEGCAHLKQILIKAPDFLSHNGYLILEIGYSQAPWFCAFVKNETPFSARFIKDHAGIDRMAICQWTKS